ncbi:hypothetical protein BHE74_00030382 [Ensete ventricosum]|nr:hypothetical protein GW17_00031814 [Ensete ventricosum]RWW62486.1 hypothetical protein BHE74_00030382 [Ensete ventricosum]RZS02781.1 hypothetical protein BHM03_00032864 [Ensete ventricosum]
MTNTINTKRALTILQSSSALYSLTLSLSSRLSLDAAGGRLQVELPRQPRNHPKLRSFAIKYSS